MYVVQLNLHRKFVREVYPYMKHILDMLEFGGIELETVNLDFMREDSLAGSQRNKKRLEERHLKDLWGKETQWVKIQNRGKQFSFREKQRDEKKRCWLMWTEKERLMGKKVRHLYSSPNSWGILNEHWRKRDNFIGLPKGPWYGQHGSLGRKDFYCWM